MTTMHPSNIKLDIKLGKVFLYSIMILLTIMTVFPLFWMFYTSFKFNADIAKNVMSLPLNPTLRNYLYAWNSGNLGTSLMNSLFYSVTATFFTVYMAMAVGYTFAKFNYRFSRFFYGFLMLGLLVTVQSALVPLYFIEAKLGIVDTRLGLIIPYIAFNLPFAVYLSYAYIKSIPNSLQEAAIIDGASYLSVFFKIIMPISKPAVATITIFTFLCNWNEFVLGYILTSSKDLRPLSVGINTFAGGRVYDAGLHTAALVIGTAPMVLFFLLFKKKITEGFAGGAIKE